MDSQAAIAILRANEAALRSRGVRHAALFGSIARGEGHPGSDLDVMIDIDTEVVRDVYDYVGVTGFIADLFPIAVDVASRDMLRPHVRPHAERDAIHAF
ncbi:nucleotidyltransferase domain-containing protein [Methylobacterium sp. J-072]|uniref:nucleotidyltransferase family protein n=1 Tax=Methylobacterium sp. J-072 TaxID=2836651 RepID=UPI001FBAA0BC|nr:nucleotidyltransferase domain-containing protein [Methylobacterium sp. J-072]MCJ2092537.1 nucleotidyltransferase domain-containing protein [Methylobacterium sp. J-072]